MDTGEMKKLPSVPIAIMPSSSAVGAGNAAAFPRKFFRATFTQIWQI